MTSKVFVVDLISHMGDARAIIGTVKEHIATKHSGARIVWCARDEQRQHLDGQEIAFDHRPETGEAYATAIRDWIVASANNGEAGSIFFVLTYNVSVLGTAAKLNDEAIVVVPAHMNNIKDGHGPRSNVPRPVPPVFVPAHPTHASLPASPNVLTREEAEALLKEVLRRGGYTSPQRMLPQAKLRFEMMKLDSRARKDPTDPDSSSLVRAIVNQGLREGWLNRMQRAGNGSECLWLSEGQALPPQSMVAGRTPIAPPEKPRAVAASADPVETVPAAAEDVRQRRADQMEDVLRAARIGSPSIPRQHIFDALEAILAGGDTKLTTSHLMARAREDAERAAKLAGYCKEQNWQAITDCVLNSMLEAGVLLGPGGNPIPRRIGVYSAVVEAVHKDFRQRSEAVMVERILKGLNDVTYNDCYSIGLALYQQGKANAVSREDLLRKVDSLLVQLESEGRAHADGMRLLSGQQA